MCIPTLSDSTLGICPTENLNTCAQEDMDKDGHFNIVPNSKRTGATQLPSEWEEVNNL